MTFTSKQLYAQVSLQYANLAAHRGLGDMQLVRGHRQVFRARHDLKHTQGIQWRYSSGHLARLRTADLGMTFYSIWMPDSHIHVDDALEMTEKKEV